MCVRQYISALIKCSLVTLQDLVNRQFKIGQDRPRCEDRIDYVMTRLQILCAVLQVFSDCKCLCHTSVSRTV